VAAKTRLRLGDGQALDVVACPAAQPLLAGYYDSYVIQVGQKYTASPPTVEWREPGRLLRQHDYQSLRANRARDHDRWARVRISCTTT